jgi:hypothetical protein
LKWPFGKREPSAIEILTGAKWTCGTCEQVHTGMFDLACRAPDPWSGDETYEPNSAIKLDGDFLSEDFCILGGEHFLVRCVLEIPVHGIAQKFSFGVWGSLSREHFEQYLEAFDSGDCGGMGPWWCWLCNTLKPHALERPLGCWMYPQLGRQRPVLKVDQADHPLAVAQVEGISPGELLDIYRLYGHAPAS